MAIIADAVPKRRRRGDTRQRLLDAALGVFARNGYDRSTVDEIVSEAGFSKGAFYVHFQSKDDLFWTMLEERINRQQEAFREALDASAPVPQNLARILTGIFDLNKREPLWTAVFTEFVAHAARNDKVRDRLATMYQSWRSFTIEVLNQGREAGIVRIDVDVEFLASVLIAVVEGTMMQSRLAPDDVQLEEHIGPLSSLLAEWLTP